MNSFDQSEIVIDEFNRPPPIPHRLRRARVFLVVFGVAALIGLVFNFARPAVYRSDATLLIEPAAAQSRPLVSSSAPGVPAAPPPQVSNDQRLATEQARLLSQPVIQVVVDEFGAELSALSITPDPFTTYQAIQRVRYDSATNLLEVAVEGPAPALLFQLLTRWLAVYDAARLTSTATALDNRGEALREQLSGIDARIKAQRADIELFRTTHGIVSDERTENREAAKFRGLNESINVAEEEELKAVGHLHAVRDAIAKGEPVTQDRDRAALERLDERVATLRDLVRAQEDQFTEKFARIAPEITAARKDLARAEQDLAEKKQLATAEVLAQAEPAVVSARANKAALLNQQAGLSHRLTAFAQRFEELTSLQKHLEDLEAQAAPLRERLVQTAIAPVDLAPTVSVLSAPSTPIRPVRPLYWRDAGICLVSAFALGMLAVLFFEFLTRQPVGDQPQGPPRIYSLNTHLFPPPLPILSHAASPQIGAPLATPLAYLPDTPRELMPAEIAALLRTADEYIRLVISLLMCGVSGDEITQLQWVNFHDLGVLEAGTPPRQLQLPEMCREILSRLAQSKAPTGFIGCNEGGAPLTAQDLVAMLNYVAHDAGIPHPDEVTPATLRHTYFAFLVRQGLKLGELPRVGGSIAPTVLAAYARFAPPGPGVTLDLVQTQYPALTLT